MYTPDGADAVTPMPTLGAPGPNPDRFLGSSSIVERDQLNSLIAEIANAITNSPGSPALDKSSVTQLGTAIEAYVAQTPAGKLTGKIFHLIDRQSSGVAGQALTTTVWNKARIATTLQNTIAGASVTSDVITLPEGKYRIRFMACMYFGVSNFIVTGSARLRNTSDGSDAIEGSSQTLYGNFGSSGNKRSEGLDDVTVPAGGKDFEIQIYPVAQAGWIGGSPSTSGQNEIYHEIIIEELAV